MTKDAQTWSLIALLGLPAVLALYVGELRQHEDSERALTQCVNLLTPAELRSLRDGWETEQELRHQGEFER